jgi:hypothetical protein
VRTDARSARSTRTTATCTTSALPLAEDAADALRHDGDGLLYLDVARERIQSIRNSVNKALSE